MKPSRLVRAGEGERIQLGAEDNYLLFKVFADETDGRFEQYLKHLPPRTIGADMHVHTDTEQYFAVLSGALTVGTNDGDFVLAPGDVAIIDRGTPHSQRNDSDGPTDVLISFAPARNHHLFFEECAKLANLPQRERLAAVAEVRRRFAGFSCYRDGTPNDGLPPIEVELGRH